MQSAIQSQKTALITGAASGVGFAIAKLCRSKGMHLALLDIDEVNLTKAKAILSDMDSSLTTEAYVIDVADPALWEKTVSLIAGAFPEIALVVLNAGKGYKAQGQGEGKLKPWLDSDYWKKVGGPKLTKHLADISDDEHELVRSTEWPQSCAPSTSRC